MNKFLPFVCFCVLECLLFGYGSVLMRAVSYDSTHAVFMFGGVLVWVSLMLPPLAVIMKLIRMISAWVEKSK